MCVCVSVILSLVKPLSANSKDIQRICRLLVQMFWESGVKLVCNFLKSHVGGSHLNIYASAPT